MTSLKAGVPCADCGESFPPPVLQWDHLPGYTKIGHLSELTVNRPRTLVLEELKKCELVCANCHAIRTWQRAAKKKSSN